MLGRTELLELLRLRARCSPGSDGRRPDDRANKLRMSVRETTPVRRPDIWAPGSADAGTLCCVVPWRGTGDGGVEPVPGTITVLLLVGDKSGVAGEDGDGEGDSTTHMRCA